MDQVIQAVYQQMLRIHRCSVDDVLESPELRNEYLTAVRVSLGNLPEQQLLHRLTILRKQSKLPRRSDSSTQLVAASKQDTNNLVKTSTVS
jgi:hypothetical protein